MRPSKAVIAIVDDDPSVCRALKRLVRSAGLEAETFSSGAELLDFLEAMPSVQFGCLVIDLQMPGMSGLDLQARLADWSMPIIFVTAHDEIGARAQAMAAGAVAYLRKPFGDDLLLRTLQEAMSPRA